MQGIPLKDSLAAWSSNFQLHLISTLHWHALAWSKINGQRWSIPLRNRDIWLLLQLPSRKGINNILKAKQILFLIYSGFDKPCNAFQGSQVIAEGRLWGEHGGFMEREQGHTGIRNFLSRHKGGCNILQLELPVQDKQPWTQQVRGKDLLFGKRFIASRCVTQHRFFFFFWGRREDFLQWFRILPGIFSNPAITLFILDSSYFSKLVTLVSICLSPTHYFWCLQSPLFNIFRVFS